MKTKRDQLSLELMDWLNANKIKFTSVGYQPGRGHEKIVLYVYLRFKKDVVRIPKEWQGAEVVLGVTGQLRPCEVQIEQSFVSRWTEVIKNMPLK